MSFSKAKLVSAARLMRVIKNTLIRPMGTFSQGKVKRVFHEQPMRVLILLALGLTAVGAKHPRQT